MAEFVTHLSEGPDDGALHDAFEEDEVQVIGSRGACAVTQSVQGLMHGYKHTHGKKRKFIFSPLPSICYSFSWEID